MSTHKTCASCKTDKPISDFSLRTKATDGLNNYCRDCSSARRRAYRQQNREALNAYDRVYRIINKNKLAQQQRAYRERKANNGICAITAKDARRLRDGGCAHAHLGNCDGRLERDHVIPTSRGGQTSIGNLQVLCRRHNAQKGTRLNAEALHGASR